MMKVTLYLDDQTWHNWRIACLQHRTSASKAAEQLIRQQLAEWAMEGAEIHAKDGNPRNLSLDNLSIKKSKRR